VLILLHPRHRVFGEFGLQPPAIFAAGTEKRDFNAGPQAMRNHGRREMNVAIGDDLFEFEDRQVVKLLIAFADDDATCREVDGAALFGDVKNCFSAWRDHDSKNPKENNPADSPSRPKLKAHSHQLMNGNSSSDSHPNTPRVKIRTTTDTSVTASDGMITQRRKRRRVNCG